MGRACGLRCLFLPQPGAPCAARGIARPLTPTLPPQRGGRGKARPSASPRVPSPHEMGRGRVRGRARSGRATRSRDPRLSPGPRRPDGKARAVAKATVLGRRPVAPWRLCSVARASPPVIRIGNPHGHDARGTLCCARDKRFRPLAGGLGSPRSRGNAHGQGCPWHTALRAAHVLAPARGRLGEPSLPSLPVVPAAQPRPLRSLQA